MPFAFLQTTIIVCLVLGLCRVGSLESRDCPFSIFKIGLCRVGSLENPNIVRGYKYLGLCRVGSLERLV